MSTGEFLKKQLNDKQLTPQQFSRLSGMRIETIAEILNGNKKISRYAAEKISAALGMPLTSWLTHHA